MDVKTSTQNLLSDLAAAMSRLIQLQHLLEAEPALWQRAGFVTSDGLDRLRVTIFSDAVGDDNQRFKHLCYGRKMFASGVNRVGECDGFILTIAPVNATVEQVMSENGMTMEASQ